MCVISPRVPGVHVISLGVPDLHLIFTSFFQGPKAHVISPRVPEVHVISLRVPISGLIFSLLGCFPEVRLLGPKTHLFRLLAVLFCFYFAFLAFFFFRRWSGVGNLFILNRQRNSHLVTVLMTYLSFGIIFQYFAGLLHALQNHVTVIK